MKLSWGLYGKFHCGWNWNFHFDCWNWNFHGKSEREICAIFVCENWERERERERGVVQMGKIVLEMLKKMIVSKWYIIIIKKNQ
jgi:hypothetical protein